MNTYRISAMLVLVGLTVSPIMVSASPAAAFLYGKARDPITEQPMAVATDGVSATATATAYDERGELLENTDRCRALGQRNPGNENGYHVSVTFADFNGNAANDWGMNPAYQNETCTVTITVKAKDRRWGCTSVVAYPGMELQGPVWLDNNSACLHP